MIERKTTLHWVLSPTAFEAINSKALISNSRPLGTGVAAVNKMISCAEEMEFVLPNILGLSPKSGTNDWATAVANYWHNFGLDVPLEGVTFDISLNVDINDHIRKTHIDALLKQVAPKAENTTDKIKAIEDHLNLESTPEEVKYRYATPNNIADYLAWRYCLVSSFVANDPELVEKSTRIQFYLMDDLKAEQRKQAAAAVRNKAIRKYSELISEKEITKIDNILIAADIVRSLKDLKKMARVDKENSLMDMVTHNSTKFLEILADKHLEVTSEIKKWSLASIINNIPNTPIYVDATDPSIVLGNSMTEVVSFVANPVNAAYLNELRIKFNALTV